MAEVYKGFDIRIIQAKTHHLLCISKDDDDPIYESAMPRTTGIMEMMQMGRQLVDLHLKGKARREADTEKLPRLNIVDWFKDEI